MWPFSQAAGEPKRKEPALLERVFQVLAEDRAAYHCGEDLTDLFERDDTKGGTARDPESVQAVRESGSGEFESFLGTLEIEGLEGDHERLQERQTSGLWGVNKRVKGAQGAVLRDLPTSGSLFQRLHTRLGMDTNASVIPELTTPRGRPRNSGEAPRVFHGF